jgi:hypothetical protein
LIASSSIYVEAYHTTAAGTLRVRDGSLNGRSRRQLAEDDCVVFGNWPEIVGRGARWGQMIEGLPLTIAFATPT